MKTVLIFRILLFSCTLMCLGCSSDSEDEKDIYGKYWLKTINGAPLPYNSFENIFHKVEVMSGYYILNRNKSFKSVIEVRDYSFRSDVTNLEIIEKEGAYSLEGNEITFGVNSYDPIIGTLTEDLISVELKGFVTRERPIYEEFNK